MMDSFVGISHVKSSLCFCIPGAESLLSALKQVLSSAHQKINSKLLPQIDCQVGVVV